LVRPPQWCSAHRHQAPTGKPDPEPETSVGRGRRTHQLGWSPGDLVLRLRSDAATLVRLPAAEAGSQARTVGSGISDGLVSGVSYRDVPSLCPHWRDCSCCGRSVSCASCQSLLLAVGRCCCWHRCCHQRRRLLVTMQTSKATSASMAEQVISWPDLSGPAPVTRKRPRIVPASPPRRCFFPTTPAL